MTTAAAAPPRATQAGPAVGPPGRWTRLGVAAFVAVVVAGVVLRVVVRSELWLDEALTVDISRVPLRDLTQALRHDGAPPLFYVLLHVWTGVLGDGTFAVRLLPALLSAASLVPGWFVGARLGRRVGEPLGWWAAPATVVLLASSPYATRYGSEVRMYSLSILLVLLGYLALVRTWERPTAGRASVLALVTAALLYNQYWALYLGAVVACGLAVAAWRRPDRRPPVVALTGLAAGALLFVPWLPVFGYQAAHTGTPWGTAAPIPSGAAFTVLDFASIGLGEARAEAWALVYPLLVVALLGVFARGLDRRHAELDLWTRPVVRFEAAAAAATVLVGLTLSWFADTAYQGRYAAVVFPLYVACVAVGITALVDVRARVGALAVLVALGFVGGVRNATTERTQARQAADAIAKVAHRGDVVAYCPDQVAPDVARLLPSRLALRQLTYPRGDAPQRVDWVDYEKRNEAADPEAFARAVLARAGPGSDVFLVWTGGYRTLEDSCERLAGALQAARTGGGYLVEADAAFFEHQNVMRFPAR